MNRHPIQRQVLRRQQRRGMTLMEIMIVMAIAIGLFAVAAFSFADLYGVQQRGAATKLAMTIQQLHDEAVMRNVTFRIAFHLSEGRWEVEAGDPKSLIFASPEDREEADNLYAKKIENLTDEEREKVKVLEQRFTKFVETFDTRGELPAGARFGGVYTPQYGVMMEPPAEGDDKTGKNAKPAVVYAYLFPNGFVEKTVIQIVSVNDSTDGFTVEVEPMTGIATVHPTLIDWESTDDFIPDEGPPLSQ